MYTKKELKQMIEAHGGPQGFIQWLVDGNISNDIKLKLENSMILVRGFPCVTAINIVAK